MTRSRFRPAARAFALLIALAVPSTTLADDYYVLVFGSQTVPKRPRFTHTWATFVRVPGVGDPARRPMEAFTVSWMPASMDIRPLARRPEPGVNLNLPDTLRAMFAEGEHVALWGPYRIAPATYARAADFVRFLESGRVGYKAIDSRRPAPDVSNCIHAVCDALGIPRYAVPEVQVQGEGASAAVVESLLASRRAVPPAQPADWIVQRLGLSQYPISRP